MTLTPKQRKEFMIKSSGPYGEHYLSPGGRRWISCDSKKHRFGFFDEATAKEFVDVRNSNPPKGTKYSVEKLTKEK